jgi:hypothetical protein
MVLGLMAELVSDFFIMGGMLYYLNGGRTSFNKSVGTPLRGWVRADNFWYSTNKALNKLIAYTINTGALTTYAFSPRLPGSS